MSVHRDDWAAYFLKRCEFPVKRRNMVALVAWMAAEGGPQFNQARWNPLNSTLEVPGSTVFNYANVQNYKTLESGLDASEHTLLQTDGAGYGPIIMHLRDNARPRETLDWVERSHWGTGGLAKSIVDDVKDHWSSYAEQPIGQ